MPVYKWYGVQKCPLSKECSVKAWKNAKVGSWDNEELGFVHGARRGLSLHTFVGGGDRTGLPIV